VVSADMVVDTDVKSYALWFFAIFAVIVLVLAIVGVLPTGSIPIISSSPNADLETGLVQVRGGQLLPDQDRRQGYAPTVLENNRIRPYLSLLNPRVNDFVPVIWCVRTCQTYLFATDVNTRYASPFLKASACLDLIYYRFSIECVSQAHTQHQHAYTHQFLRPGITYPYTFHQCVPIVCFHVNKGMWCR
jgi:hypothetical protein